MSQQQLYKFLRVEIDDRDGVTLEESGELVRDVEDLHRMSLLMCELIDKQGIPIETIENSTSSTVNNIVNANCQLMKVVNHQNKSNVWIGTLSGLAGGLVTGGVTGLCLGGVTAMPLLVVGGVGGAVIGLGASKGVNGLAKMVLIQKLQRRIDMLNNKYQFDRDTAIDVSEVARKGDEGDVSHDNDNDNDNDNNNKTRTAQNLEKALLTISQTNEIVLNSYQNLVLQGEKIDRSIRAVTEMFCELEKSGHLIARLHSNAISYILSTALSDNRPILERIVAPGTITQSESCESEVPPLEEENRRGRKWFHSWRDVSSTYDSLLLLQEWNLVAVGNRRSRIVAVNPGDDQKIVVLIKCNSKNRDENVDMLRHLSLILSRLFPNMDNSTIYQLLRWIPELNQQTRFYSKPDILDQMMAVIRRSINPCLKSINAEVAKQNETLDGLSDQMCNGESVLQKHLTSISRHL